jgi:methylthioribose-1-phosphate isomerase
MSAAFQTIEWHPNGYLRLLDQTRLPAETVYLDCRTVEEVWHAIKRLSVRGAPAIGVAAAYGVCLANSSREAMLRGVQREVGLRGAPLAAERSSPAIDSQQLYLTACDYLATSRPTAVNLFWALERMRGVVRAKPPAALAAALLAEAKTIHEEDRQQCAAIGRHGAELFADLPDGMGILTHCNTGALATGGDGTALAVIFALHARGRRPQVFADETRPLLQGARLTMWELAQRGVDCTLICDSMAAQVMREGRVQAVIVGADRIAANGDAANKIGTYSVAVNAKHHGIPFYVAAPTTTFDMAIASGAEIPIEQRAAEEITHGFGSCTAPAGVRVYNPAFDVTPAELITAIITERGVAAPHLAAEVLAADERG